MGIRKQYARYKELREAHRQFTELNNRLVKAVFAPAIADNWFEGVDCHDYEDKDRYGSMIFLMRLITLSEFYIAHNPVLSSALWAIWDNGSYYRTKLVQKGFFRINMKEEKKMMAQMKAFVASATIHYSDGGAGTYHTGYALNQMDKYASYADTAIKNLESMEIEE